MTQLPMRAPTTHAEPRQEAMAVLRRVGAFDPAAVDFLADHPQLLPIVAEAPARIHQEFGTAPVRADVYHDPEEDYDELFLVVESPWGVDETLEREQRLLDHWFLDQFPTVAGLLSVTATPR